MTDKELKQCKEFLDYFGVNYNDDVIKLTSGGNSCIMNPDTQWKDFLGYSINGVATAVAKELGKKTIYIDDFEGYYNDPL